MMSPRVQVSCALLKLCGTTASIVRAGYGCKQKYFFIARWDDEPCPQCVNSAGAFGLIRTFAAAQWKQLLTRLGERSAMRSREDLLPAFCGHSAG